MASERIQHRIERLLDLANKAADQGDWEEVHQRVEDVLAVDPDNVDVEPYIVAVEQHRIELLLDQVDEAADQRDWEEVRRGAKEVLSADPENVDAHAYLVAAERMIGEDRPPVVVVEEELSGTILGHVARRLNRPSVQAAITHDRLIRESRRRAEQVTSGEPAKQEERDEPQTKPAKDSRRSRYYESMARRYRTSTPIKKTSPEVVDQKPEHTIGAGQTEDYRKPPKRTWEGFHWHWGMLKRILLIAVVGLTFGLIGQFIAIFIFGLTYDEGSWAFVLIGYITGGIIGNKLYDQGVG